MIEQFQAWNHFVPRLYLKRFASSPGLLWHYPLLASHESVPIWSKVAISRVGARSHLYTLSTEDAQSDSIERWLCKEFEDPADEAIERAVSGARMTRTHWRSLARYFGAQSARTPASYLKSQERWQQTMPAEMENTLQQIKKDLETKSADSFSEPDSLNEYNKLFPMRYTISAAKTPGMSEIHVEVAGGRKLWLWSLKLALRQDGPISHLDHHSWTIFTAPEDCFWFTSDNPAVQMGIGSDGARNLGGGWNSEGTVLMLPLDTKQLLYCEIGRSAPEKYTVLQESKFHEIQRVIAHNASRSIFADRCISNMPLLRSRHVDSASFNFEKEQWREWHEHHTDAERFIK